MEEVRMQYKKIILYLLVTLSLIAIVIFSYWIFIDNQKPCAGTGWPAPGPSPLKFGSYYMITDQGRLYIGQTYNHQYEGPWVGNMTLLYMDNRGATFLVRYPEGSGDDFKIMSCKQFYPRTPDNKIEE
jgi:hypothetical protein